MPSRLCLHRVLTASGLALLTLACSDKSPVEPGSQAEVPSAEVLSAELVVSDPFFASPASSAQAGSARASIASDDGGVTYVSLPPGSVPNGITVTIRNSSSGASPTQPSPFLDGGFDPVRVVAGAGDELEIRITVAGGPTTVSKKIVPRRSPPKIVRTNPPNGMIDVALNSRVFVVLTEPIAPATATTATVRLLQGTTLVPGTVRLVEGTLFEAEFVPDEELARGTTYSLVVTQGVLDADGDSLETPVTTQFTTSTIAPAPTFGIVFNSISFGVTNHACGLDQTGLAYCWGDNHAGALGAGDQLGYTDIPLLVTGAPRRFSSLSAGYYATCGIEAPTRFAYCWGHNFYGDLGDGTFTTRWVPTPVSKGIRFSSISASGGLTCGVEAQTGLGYCWGRGGAIGDGTFSQHLSPTLVGSGSLRFTSISTSGPFTKGSVGEELESRGSNTGGFYACALEAQTGLAYCWGSNDFGQLGDGTTTDRLVPTLVGGGSLRFSSIDAGDLLTCGVEAQTGAVYCWGSNEFGQVGDGTTTTRLVPTLLGGGDRRFISVNAGDLTCGIEAQTGVAYCWGLNNPAPRSVGDGSQRFSSIVSAGGMACGVEAQTGRGYCWDHTQLIPTLLASYPPTSP